MHAENAPASVVVSLTGAMATATVTMIQVVLSLSNATPGVIAPAGGDIKGKEHVSVVLTDEKEAAPRAILHYGRWRGCERTVKLRRECPYACV
jgi:hypothetical protein